MDDKARYKFTIAAIYRLPDYSAIENFSEALSNSLHLLTERKGIYCLLRDININISSDKRIPVTETYLICLTGCGAIPITSIPTCVAGNFLTVIDHIITKDSPHFIEPGVICSNLSSLSLYSLYYAEACNELAEPISESLRLWATRQLHSKKRCSGGEPLKTLCPI